MTLSYEETEVLLRAIDKYNTIGAEYDDYVGTIYIELKGNRALYCTPNWDAELNTISFALYHDDNPELDMYWAIECEFKPNFTNEELLNNFAAWQRIVKEELARVK